MSESRLLTDAERQRFIRWLEEDAMSSEAIAEQTGKLPGLDVLARQLRAEALACRVVAKKLRQTEGQTIQGPAAGGPGGG